MKQDRNGQAAILSDTQLKLLFDSGFSTPRDKALFGICLFTACRISEALQLEKVSVKADYIILKKTTTKGKKNTREIAICDPLGNLLNDYNSPCPLNPYYFPGYKGYLKINQAYKILKKACLKLGIKGVSTHSFRRTALTQMSRKGIPLRTIQEISGHTSLLALQKYLEVTEDEKLEALKAINWGGK